MPAKQLTCFKLSPNTNGFNAQTERASRQATDDAWLCCYRHMGKALTAKGDGARGTVLEKPCEAGRHHSPGRYLNTRLAEGNCVHHLGGKYSSSAPVHLFHGEEVLVSFSPESICLSKHQSEHTSTWNWTEVNISPFLAPKRPSSRRQLFGITDAFGMQDF